MQSAADRANRVRHAGWDRATAAGWGRDRDARGAAARGRAGGWHPRVLYAAHVAAECGGRRHATADGDGLAASYACRRRQTELPARLPAISDHAGADAVG